MINIRKIYSVLVAFGIAINCQPAMANTDVSYVSFNNVKDGFGIAENGNLAPVLYSSGDFPGVIKAVNNFSSDIKMVTGKSPELFTDKSGSEKQLIIIGTLGKSPLIDQLVQNKKLDVSKIKDKWEGSLTQIVLRPMPGVEKALVIAGADKRGTIYGIYSLSAQIGVSPWFWWADVPVKQRSHVFVNPTEIVDAPAVKYRGIFLNDEAPALTDWAKEKFGGFNSKFYEKVFELILRLKGNYLWPAMWGSRFYVDDPLNARLADDMGIVMGTSHHEPLGRAHAEWKGFGKGSPWNYATNETVLREFWQGGMKRIGNYETVVTVGMRGDGDEPMSKESNVELLERIVNDQRSIIESTTGKPASETPQIWALYKEVQDYYDKGMRVPDDITLLLCDDNWGNIRKLPAITDKPRKGGYGIYYHFDYVGGPRNYKWLNTNPIAKVWEQMHLARQYGADRLWLVNVGDLKPMEFPIEFFLDYAWNPEKWPANRLQEYTRLWVEKQFGATYAVEIADLISKYTKYNGRVKPELLNDNTYSLINYREFETVVADYDDLLGRAKAINEKLPPEARDAFFQLVLHPITACANLTEMYYALALNKMYAKQGRSATNDFAARVKALFAKDAEITNQYNKLTAGGKWNHMMDQTHIGYTTWQEPRANIMPVVEEIQVPAAGSLALSIEGTKRWWPESKDEAILPQLNPWSTSGTYFELFNRGKALLTYQLKASSDCIKLSKTAGSLDKQERIKVAIDWNKAPAGLNKLPVTISSGNKTITVFVALNNVKHEPVAGFIEDNGKIAIDASNYTREISMGPVRWTILPDHGKTASAVTVSPVTAGAVTKLDAKSPHLEYDVYLFSKGSVRINAHFSPTLNFTTSKGLRYAISIDDEEPKIVNIHDDLSERAWAKSVSENIKILTTGHSVAAPGKHTIKFWMVDAGLVLQRIVVDTGNLRPSYLGPPQSTRK